MFLSCAAKSSTDHRNNLICAAALVSQLGHFLHIQAIFLADERSLDGRDSREFRSQPNGRHQIRRNLFSWATAEDVVDEGDDGADDDGDNDGDQRVPEEGYTEEREDGSGGVEGGLFRGRGAARRNSGGRRSRVI